MVFAIYILFVYSKYHILNNQYLSLTFNFKLFVFRILIKISAENNLDYPVKKIRISIFTRLKDYVIIIMLSNP
jgi:hypothetical protein